MRQNNTQAIIRTLLNTEITGDYFLPVSLILLSLAWAGITVSVLSCPVCDVAEGQSNLSLQMSSDNRMLLRIQSGKLQHTRKTDVIGAQIIGNAHAQTCLSSGMFSMFVR